MRWHLNVPYVLIPNLYFYYSKHVWITESHWVRFRDLYILVYINDLHKIINKTSTPIIFADDPSILFTRSNLADLNKNIYNVFETLNKWLIANEQSLLLISKCQNMHVYFIIENDLLCLFSISYELYFGETRHVAPQFLKYKEGQLEFWKAAGTESHVENNLRNYNFCLWHHNIFYLY